KELDQGPEGFQLQYMLDTSLADELRQQLKPADFLIADFEADMIPEVLVWRASRENEVVLPPQFPLTGVKLHHPEKNVQTVWVDLPKERLMYIDPAGGGADEIGYAVSTALGPYIHVLDVGGIHGGLTDKNGLEILRIVQELGVTFVKVESNMGHGLFEANLRGV